MRILTRQLTLGVAISATSLGPSPAIVAPHLAGQQSSSPLFLLERPEVQRSGYVSVSREGIMEIKILSMNCQHSYRYSKVLDVEDPRSSSIRDLGTVWPAGMCLNLNEEVIAMHPGYSGNLVTGRRYAIQSHEVECDLGITRSGEKLIYEFNGDLPDDSSKLDALVSHICWVIDTKFWPVALEASREAIKTLMSLLPLELMYSWPSTESERELVQQVEKAVSDEKFRVEPLVADFKSRGIIIPRGTEPARVIPTVFDRVLVNNGGVFETQAKRCTITLESKLSWEANRVLLDALKEAFAGVCLHPSDATIVPETLKGVWLDRGEHAAVPHDGSGHLIECDHGTGSGGIQTYQFPFVEIPETSAGLLHSITYNPLYGLTTLPEGTLREEYTKSGDPTTNLQGRALEIAKGVCASLKIVDDFAKKMTNSRTANSL